MKFEILQEELVNGLSTVLKAVSTRVQLPILSYVKMEVEKNGIFLTATDLEIGIRLRLNANIETEGVVAIPGKMIEEFLLTLKPGKIKGELVESQLKLRSVGSSATFLTLGVDDFPQLPEFEKTQAKIKAEDVAGAAEEVVFASAKESLRPTLIGVLMEVGKKMRLVATDGFRLAVTEVGVVRENNEELNLLIPNRAIVEMSKIIKKGEMEISYLEKTKQVAFRQGEILFTSQLIDGNFPEYQKILPKEFSTELEVGREELLSAVKTAHVFARDNSNMMKWKIAEGKIAISSQSPSRGECSVEVGAKANGSEMEVVFNAKYVMDYLAIKNCESLWVGLGGKLAPGMIREKRNSGGFYVVMPINA